MKNIMEVCCHALVHSYIFDTETEAQETLESLQTAIEACRSYKLNNKDTTFKFSDSSGENVLVLDKVETVRIYDPFMFYEKSDKIEDIAMARKLRSEELMLQLKAKYK